MMQVLDMATVSDIEVQASSLDVQKAAAVYKQHGCLVVRGLLEQYVPEVSQDIDFAVKQAESLLDQAQKVTEGWLTPDGTLWIPAPPGFHRDRQIMVLAMNYRISGAFFRSAFDDKLISLVSAIQGADIELYQEGQCLYKEPVGGHPKNLHQDSAYFEHLYEGPVAALTYVVDTNLINGALHVVPGSHKLDTLPHIDTLSHLGLDEKEWPWESAVPVVGNAGDSIFFHYKTIHGSKENHSEAPRPVFIHRYRKPGDVVTITGSTVENRAESAKLAKETEKSKQPGLMVCGRREYGQ